MPGTCSKAPGSTGIPLAPGREIVHNDRVDGRLVTVVHDIDSGERRILPRPINVLSRNGRHALCLDYGRMGRMRKVVGYQGAEDPYPDDPHPKKDGIFRLDMQSGEVTLLYSIHEVWEQLVERHPELHERHMWFNHTTINPSGTRFYFLARAWSGGVENTHLQSALYTGAMDGGDLRCLIDFGGFRLASGLARRREHGRDLHHDTAAGTGFAAAFHAGGPGRGGAAPDGRR